MEKQTTVEFLVRFPEVLGKSGTTSSKDILINPINQGKQMTPKEKAEELFNHYHNLIQSIGGELGQEILVSILAKQSALFAAKQCQKELVEIGNYNYYYWEEVEHEIQNL